MSMKSQLMCWLHSFPHACMHLYRDLSKRIFIRHVIRAMHCVTINSFTTCGTRMVMGVKELGASTHVKPCR